MILLDNWEMGCWAYFQCLDGNDTEEIRSLIMDEWWAYLYCIVIKDRPDVRRYITSKVFLKKLEKIEKK